jgi:GWxTD domain-containing protein
VAVAASGNRREYVLALAALEQNRSLARDAALAASGGSLVRRIRRLINQPEGPRAGLTPLLSVLLLLIPAALTLMAWQSKPAEPLPLPPAPAAASPTGQTADSPFYKWLNEDVAYIVTDRERDAFLALQTDAEREHFIEQFWLRRDPTPGTERNEAKEEHYRRIAYANDHFFAAGVPGWQTDRGRVYIVYGPPDEIESHALGSASTYPFEQWLYRSIKGVGSNVVVEFVDATWSANYRLTANPAQKQLPPGTPTGRFAPFSAAAVRVDGDTATFSIPLEGFANHQIKILARILNSAGRGAGSWELGVQCPAPAVNRQVTLASGFYRLKLGIKDVTTGDVADQVVDFEVK